ncbi:MAG TPA: hypothetical protein VFQ22_06470, partial [Longimicrobiales bacterium]|nr:hypothetical protein [Longimicrobiales bacterium]
MSRPVRPTRRARPRLTGRSLAAVTLLAAAACQQDAPLAVDDSQLPREPVTARIELPWSEFGSNLEVYGGYGRPLDVNAGYLAHAHQGALEARTLLRFGPYPRSATVRDANGALRTDNDIWFYQGYVMLRFDTAASNPSGVVTIGLGATQVEWHPRSASWEAAVDTVGDVRPWPEPGGGPVTPITSNTWSATVEDSIQMFVDSATIAAWGDTLNVTRGARVELLTEGPRLRIREAALRLYARSEIDPDTTIFMSAAPPAMTFIYTPAPQPAPGQITFGGAPAWRTVMDVLPPTQVTGPPELCEAVGCPFTLGPQHVSYAALRLTTQSPDSAFRPQDSVAVDVRAVLSRASLPKSPMSASYLAGSDGVFVPEEAFVP